MKFALKYFYLPVVLFVAFSILHATEVSAATLYFSPSSGDISVGNILTTSVLVNTQNQAINNSSAVINFPAGLLEVVSVSKSGSIFSLWVEEPAFSNSEGTISFDGGLPTPGFNGTAGKLLSVVFRVRNAGSASLIFSSAAVRANDGFGTDILQTKAQAQFNLISEVKPIVPPPTAPGTPQASSISSPTHPDSAKWYARADAKFQWDLPKDATQVSFLLDANPRTETEKLRGLISEYTYQDLDDGVWYFHLKFKSANGWGATTHYPIKIDTQKPLPMLLTFPHGNVSLDNRPTVLFNTTDSLSGIDYYEVQIGENTYYKLLPGEVTDSNPYVIPPEDPGQYQMTVVAYDKAGNATQATGNFEIIGISSPQITKIPEKLSEGDILIVEGRTYPTATVVAILENHAGKKAEERTFTNSLGQFKIVWSQHLVAGDYTFSAYVIDENGVKSPPTLPSKVLVTPKYLWHLGPVGFTFFSTILLNMILFIIFNSLIAYWIYHLLKIRSDLREKMGALEGHVDTLHEYVRKKKKTKTGDRIEDHLDGIEKIIKTFRKE